MHRGILKIASLLGALSVALGAFGAHGLKKMVSENAVSTFETAVRYQFYHVFALLVVGLLYKEFVSKTLLYSARFFMLGIILFSGSLYVLTFLQAAVMPGYKWVGAITPVGGLCFIAGWLLLFYAVWQRSRKIS
ncbi:MAG: DUF423 domain-containing protein [Ferruginibacter sp.]